MTTGEAVSAADSSARSELGSARVGAWAACAAGTGWRALFANPKVVSQEDAHSGTYARAAVNLYPWGERVA